MRLDKKAVLESWEKIQDLNLGNPKLDEDDLRYVHFALLALYEIAEICFDAAKQETVPYFEEAETDVGKMWRYFLDTQKV